MRKLKEADALTPDCVGKYVRIIRGWRDRVDRINPEIYVISQFLPGGETFIFKSLLTDAFIHVPLRRTTCDIPSMDHYVFFTKKEAAAYIDECLDRAISDDTYLTQLMVHMSIKKQQCSKAKRELN